MSLSEERTCCRPAVELGHEIDWITATQRRQRLQPNVKDEATSAGFLPLLGLPVAGGVVCYPAAEQVDYANCIDPRVASSDRSFSLFLFFLPPHPHTPPSPPSNPPPPPPPPPQKKKTRKTCCIVVVVVAAAAAAAAFFFFSFFFFFFFGGGDGGGWVGGGALLLF